MREKSTDKNMSDEAIQRGSGKTWDEWYALLDEWGATERSHTEIVRYVHQEFGVDAWYSQSVVVGYERARGMRDIGERPDGSFDTSASKTFAVPLETLFPAWVDDDIRNEWLAPGTLTLRTSQENRSARFDDNEYGGIIALSFADKGAGRSSVTIQIVKLPTKDTVTEHKATWKARLADLTMHFGKE